MIIRNLTLHNFGVYAGTNTFEFNNEKPIVLVAGMNGRGKTTFLEAVLLALYGSNSFAYKESAYQTYGKYLKSFVNRNSWTQKAYVEMEFLMDSHSNERYLIKREWNALTKRTKEEIYVEKNGVRDEFLMKNWSMFIENILPSALSNFFFFDGEKIAELAVDSTNTQLKDSIRAMLGLSVIDLLHRDLARNISRLSKLTFSQSDQRELDKLKEVRDKLESALEKKQAEIEKIKIRQLKKGAELSKLQEEYSAAGGTAFEERQKLEKKRAETSLQLEQNRAMLFDVAASELPLQLVNGLLVDISKQSENEHKDSMMQQTLANIKHMYTDYEASDVEKVSIDHFLEYVVRKTADHAVEPIYNLSNHGLLQLSGLLDKGLYDSKQNAVRLLKSQTQIQHELDTIDSYLSADIDEGEIKTIHKKIHKLLIEKYDFDLKIEVKEQEKKAIERDLDKAVSEYQHAVDKMLSIMETTDENEREIKYSHMAEKILKEYSVKLQERKVMQLASTITSCYKMLANKKNMIHRIVMNSETLEITYLDENDNTVPKSSLSAGEKQLMVIAILWALAKCSKKKLPVIIDTPLSRLDSAHRTALITTYFPNASDQTIILSTDAEIDQAYYDLMKENVGDEFTLSYNDVTKSTHIQHGYFLEGSTS